MSHNFHLMPLKHRRAAARELEQSKVKGPGQAPRRKRRFPKNLLLEYTRRARTHRWLETHIWHAKRCHMSSLWGYRLATECCDGGLKASYHATVYGSTVYDASYYTTIELIEKDSAGVGALLDVLKSVCSPACVDLHDLRVRCGQRRFRCWLYAPTKYPFGAIAPVECLFSPPATGNSGAASPCLARLWITVHASQSAFCKRALQAAAAGRSVAVASLSDQLCRFEIRGGRAHELVCRVLEMAPTMAGSVAMKVWKELRKISSSSVLPSEVVLGLEVMDPRLVFPPHRPSGSKRPAPERSDLTTGMTGHRSLLHLLSKWPDGVGRSRIWDAETRSFLLSHVESEAAISYRRRKRILAGLPPKLAPTDPEAGEMQRIIPVLLLHVPGAARGFNSGWDLICPAGFGIAFWRALVYGGARPIAMDDRRRQLCEEGRGSFPVDDADTAAFAEWHSYEALRAAEHWHRRPPSKRLNFQKLGIESPFLPPLGQILRLPLEESPFLVEYDTDLCNREHWLQTAMALGTCQDSLKHFGFPRDRSPADQQDGPVVSDPVQPPEEWEYPYFVLRDPSMLELVHKLAVGGSSVAECWSAVCRLKKVVPDLDRALVKAVVFCPGRGFPRDRALLYLPSDADLCQGVTELELPPRRVPSEFRTLVGVATSGMNSFVTGRGSAVVTLALSLLLDHVSRHVDGSRSRAEDGIGSDGLARTEACRLWVRNQSSRVCRPCLWQPVMETP